MEPGFATPQIDTSKPHPARKYNAYLGKDNYPVDREAARHILRDFPEVRAIALANRVFLQRAVRFLAAEAGIRQSIDIGTGIPQLATCTRLRCRQRQMPGQSSMSVYRIILSRPVASKIL